MIVISTYNPDTPRTTQDEELLTTMLGSLIAHRARCNHNKISSKAEEDKTYWLSQTILCDRLIGLVYPLLGLDFTEVHELIKIEENK